MVWLIHFVTGVIERACPGAFQRRDIGISCLPAEDLLFNSKIKISIYGPSFMWKMKSGEESLSSSLLCNLQKGSGGVKLHHGVISSPCSILNLEF